MKHTLCYCICGTSKSILIMVLRMSSSKNMLLPMYSLLETDVSTMQGRLSFVFSLDDATLLSMSYIPCMGTFGCVHTRWYKLWKLLPSWKGCNVRCLPVTMKGGTRLLSILGQRWYSNFDNVNSRVCWIWFGWQCNTVHAQSLTCRILSLHLSLGYSEN